VRRIAGTSAVPACAAGAGDARRCVAGAPQPVRPHLHYPARHLDAHSAAAHAARYGTYPGAARVSWPLHACGPNAPEDAMHGSLLPVQSGGRTCSCSPCSSDSSTLCTSACRPHPVGPGAMTPVRMSGIGSTCLGSLSPLGRLTSPTRHRPAVGAVVE